LRGFFFGFGGLNAIFIAASKTTFTFCKQNKTNIILFFEEANKYKQKYFTIGI